MTWRPPTASSRGLVLLHFNRIEGSQYDKLVRQMQRRHPAPCRAGAARRSVAGRHRARHAGRHRCAGSAHRAGLPRRSTDSPASPHWCRRQRRAVAQRRRSGPGRPRPSPWPCRWPGARAIGRQLFRSGRQQCAGGPRRRPWAAALPQTARTLARLRFHMTDTAPIIRGVLIQVADARLLLPNATIAEVLSHADPEPIADAPTWLLGRIPLAQLAVAAGVVLASPGSPRKGRPGQQGDRAEGAGRRYKASVLRPADLGFPLRLVTVTEGCAGFGGDDASVPEDVLARVRLNGTTRYCRPSRARGTDRRALAAAANRSPRKTAAPRSRRCRRSPVHPARAGQPEVLRNRPRPAVRGRARAATSEPIAIVHACNDASRSNERRRVRERIEG